MAPVDLAPENLGLEAAKAFVIEHAIVLVATLSLIVLLQIVLFSKRSIKPFLDPGSFQGLQLASKRFITHNTLCLRFDLPSKAQRLGLPIGQHITFWAKDVDGKDVYRAYTPTSDDDLLGAVEFVIKIYPTGKMSQVLNTLEVGGTMLMKGPKGRLQYKPNMKKHIGMLAGGSGITPMYQVLNAILKNKSDTTCCSLVFGNVSADDILLKAELDALAASNPGRFKVHYLLNSPPEGWAGGRGFITADVVRTHMPPPSADTLVMQCGPLPMTEAVKKCLDEVGFDALSQFQF